MQELVLLAHSSRTKRPSEPRYRNLRSASPHLCPPLSLLCVSSSTTTEPPPPPPPLLPDLGVWKAAAREDKRQKATARRASPVEAEWIQVKHSEWFFIPCSCEGCCGSVCPSASSSCSFCREDDDGDDGAAGSARFRNGGRGSRRRGRGQGEESLLVKETVLPGSLSRTDSGW